MTATERAPDMALVGPITKRCKTCGEVKPASDFYKAPSNRDGLMTQCKSCNLFATRARRARKRAEMGEDAWREYVREIVARSRKKRGSERERAYNRAKGRAVQRLIEMYPKAFDRLLALELDAEERKDRANAG